MSVETVEISADTFAELMAKVDSLTEEIKQLKAELEDE